MCNDCCCCDDKRDKDGQTLTRRNVCCTDIFFLILFVAFWCGMIYIAVFSLNEGDAWRIMYGYDSFGNTCNEDNRQRAGIANLTSLSGMEMTGRKHVFFLNVLDPKESMEICVSKCPTDMLYTPLDVYKFSKENDAPLCRYDIDIEKYKTLPMSSWSKQGPCPQLPVFASVSLLSRCVPDPTKVLFGEKKQINETDAISIIDFINAEGLVQQIIADVAACWKELLYLSLIALGIAFVMVVLIRYVAFILVWIVVILAAVGSLVGTGILWWTWYELKHTERFENSEWELPLLNVDVKNEQFFLVFAIVATVFTVFLLIIILVMRSRLGLVVALFHESGKCLTNMPLLLVQPIWTFLILMVFFAYWLVVLAFIGTVGEPYPSDEKGFDVPTVEYNKTEMIDAFFWYHVVGLIWTAEFILACEQFIIASAVSMWYFNRNKSTLNCTPCKAICRLLLHHIGTVAFGSFIITLVKIPRYILMYIQAKCKDSENLCAKACLKCCICCLWCLEKLLKFLNQNAYTIVSIEGKSFCPAAKRAFTIIANNVLRVATINSVGDFVLFLGKIGVTAATCVISVIWLKGKEDVHLFAFPVLLISIIAFLIADCFFTVYETVIDALLLCFCEDCELNDGSEESPYFMSTSLMKYVTESSGQLNNKPVETDPKEMGLMKKEGDGKTFDPI